MENDKITIMLSKKDVHAALLTMSTGITQLGVLRDLGPVAAGMPPEAQEAINNVALDATQVYNRISKLAKDLWPVKEEKKSDIKIVSK